MFLISRSISTLSDILCRRMCPKYLNSTTNCNFFPFSLSAGKVFEIILVLSLGGNTMQTVLHKFTVNCKTAACLAGKLMRCWRACHVGAHSTGSSAYASTFINTPPMLQPASASTSSHNLVYIGKT